MAKSEDALDQYRGRQKMGKAEKAAYAKQMFEQELLQPPKNPIAPLVLPKKPPHRRHEEPDPPPAARAGNPPPTTPRFHAPPRPPPDPRVAAATPATLADPTFAPWYDLIRGH